MPSVQQIVDEARTLINSKDMTKSARLQTAGEDLAGACVMAEDRLRRCQELLQAGYRCEAVSLAEMNPPLLDVLTKLNFPERPLWDELMAMYSMPLGPNISLARASELNRAYSDMSTVRDQVRQYRHLSRARASLVERSALLRDLAAKDPNGHLWREQLAGLEDTLKVDLTNEITRDLGNNDRSRMPYYFAALTAPGWIKPPLPTLIAKVARECLPGFLGRLKQAATADDLAIGDQLLPEWNQLAKYGSIGPEDQSAQRAAQFFERFQKVRDRAAREQEVRQTMDLLKETLTSATSTEEELMGRYANAKALGVKIPQILQSQYEERLKLIDDRKMTKELVYSIIGILMGTLALITFLVLLLRK